MRNTKWTKENCQEEALKYTKRSEYQKNSGGSYNTSSNNGWLDEICSHMISSQKPSGYWTKEKCQEESLKYNRRIDFCKGSRGAQKSAYKNGWLDEICSHMIEINKNNNI